jgi:hypothetical protein
MPMQTSQLLNKELIGVNESAFVDYQHTNHNYQNMNSSQMENQPKNESCFYSQASF